MTDLAVLREAAKVRGEQMRQTVDRPSQRRCSDDPQSPARAVLRGAQMQVRMSDTANNLAFHGLASRTDTPYEMYDFAGPYVETVVRGAFGKTLAQGPDVPLVLDHVRSQVFARTTSAKHPLMLAETTDGLECDAPNPDWSGFDWLPEKIQGDLINEMSFRFSITRGQWSPDFMEYHIEEVDIDRGDVAIVGYGANPNTVSQLRGVALGRSALGDTSADVELDRRTDAFVVEEFRRYRAELRTRGIKPPMSLEDIAS